MHSGLLFFSTPPLLFCTYIGCRLPRVVIGDVKSNEYRSKVSELRFELQRKAPAARRIHAYRKNMTREGWERSDVKKRKKRA